MWATHLVLVSYFGGDPEAEVIRDGGADGHGRQKGANHEDQEPEEPGQLVVGQSSLGQATCEGHQIKIELNPEHLSH